MDHRSRNIFSWLSRTVVNFLGKLNLSTHCSLLIKKMYTIVFVSWEKLIACFPSYLSDYLFKLLLIGDSGVGKSCLLLRFAVRIEWIIFSFSSFKLVLFFGSWCPCMLYLAILICNRNFLDWICFTSVKKKNISVLLA